VEFSPKLPGKSEALSFSRLDIEGSHPIQSNSLTTYPPNPFAPGCDDNRYFGPEWRRKTPLERQLRAAILPGQAAYMKKMSGHAPAAVNAAPIVTEADWRNLKFLNEVDLWIANAPAALKDQYKAAGKILIDWEAKKDPSLPISFVNLLFESLPPLDTPMPITYLTVRDNTALADLKGLPEDVSNLTLGIYGCPNVGLSKLPGPIKEFHGNEHTRVGRFIVKHEKFGEMIHSYLHQLDKWKTEGKESEHRNEVADEMKQWIADRDRGSLVFDALWFSRSPSFENLPYKIQTLHVEQNPALTHFEGFPEGIEEIVFKDCDKLKKLAKLPEGLKNFAVFNCKLDDTCLQSPLPASSEQVNLTNNVMTKLPDMSACVRLESLNASGNQLGNEGLQLPLPSLKRLDLSNNLLTEWPDLSACASLRKLNLSGNQITEGRGQKALPSSIKELDLSNNSLTGLPDNIWTCEKLETVDLRGNPLSPETIHEIQHASFNHPDFTADILYDA
jgi:Leucine Rich repeats (2 copies)/Leucine Rich Repeat